MTVDVVPFVLAIRQYFRDLLSHLGEVAMPSLCDQLEDDGLRPSGIDGKAFVPFDFLEEAINNESVKDTLGMTGGTCIKARKPSDLPDRITKDAKRIFAALVLMDRVDAIESLLDEGLTDEHLPLSRDPKYDAVLSRDGETTFQFGGLGRPTITEFIKRKQWLFLAPILETNGDLIEVDQECALPFTESEVIGNGQAGVVHRAKIYQAHQRGFEVSALSRESNLRDTKVFRQRQSISKLLSRTFIRRASSSRRMRSYSRSEVSSTPISFGI
jgi:hypothetical protein